MKGAYKFNDVINFEILGNEGNFTSKLPFLSNNIRFNSFVVDVVKQSISYNNIDIYNKGWIDKNYKTITFFGELETDEYFPNKETFINWIKTNSSKIKIENSKSVQLQISSEDEEHKDINLFPKTLVTSILNADGTQWIPPESGSGNIGGGGGGTGENNNISLGTTDLKSQVIAFGSKVLLKFTWSSQSDGDGILNIKVNGDSKKFQTIAQGPQEIDVTNYLTSAADYSIDFIIEDIVGNKGALRFLIKIVNLTLTSTFDQYDIQKGTVPFKFTATGDADKKLVLKIDNQVIEKENIVSGVPSIYNLTNLTHGVHRLEAYIEANIGTSSLKSNILKYKFGYAEEGNQNPVIVIFNEIEEYKNGQVISVNFLAYNSSTLETPIYLELNDQLVYQEPLVVGRRVQAINLNNYNIGDNKVKVYFDEDNYDQFDFSVVNSNINVSAIEDNLALFLKSSGKTNSSSDKEIWEYNNISTTFNNFNWETDGWKEDEKGITALKMTGGSNIEINYKPFEVDFKSSGKVIELEFMTSNVTNYDSTIIDIKGDNEYGIISKATELQFKSSSVSINSKFKENEHLRIAISIEMNKSNRFIKTYINGVLSGVKVYASNEEFVQSNPVNIKIGDIQGSCDVYLYKIRIYDTELSDINILNNYIADNDNFDEKLSLYNRNQIYTSNYEVNIDEVKKVMPVLIITAPALPPDKKTYLNATWELIHPTDNTQNWKKEVEFAVQGTSSTQYVVKNYQMRLKDDSEENRIALFNGAIKEKALTLKVDYASSAGVYNIGNAKIVDQLYRELNYLNPRQTNENTVRNSLYGYPVAVFYRKYETDTPEFHCKGSLNLSKEALALGYSGKDESWSTEDNISPLCLFDTVDFQNNDISKAFDARYNGNDSGDEYSNLKDLIRFVYSYKNNPSEFSKHANEKFNINYLLLYYVFGMIIGGADSFAKNMYLAYFEKDKKWYPQFYDIDTTWGINNTGELSFGYNSEFKDKAKVVDEETNELKDSYIFNGANSVLWNLVEEAFSEEIASLYRTLRANNYITLESITDILIGKGIDQYTEAIYNEDANLKYIDPYIDGRDTTRLSVLLGSTEEHLKYWIQNRLYYLDSKWDAGIYRNDKIALRTATAKSDSNISFDLTSFRDMYMRVQFATNYYQEQRANKNTDYNLTINYPSGTNPNDTEISIFGASSYTKIGDLSNLYLRKVDVSLATSLVELKVGSDEYGYSNPNLTEFQVGANKLLKKINITNCTSLTGDIDVSQCTNLEEFYASGTRITNISFPSGGRLKKVFIPNTVESLYISNQKNVESFITNGIYKRIKIENCNIQDLSYVRNSINAKKLTHLRLVGIDWQLEDSSLIEYIYNNLQGIDENNNITLKPVLTGKIHFNKITERNYNKYKALWGEDLTITYGEGDNPQFAREFEVTFVDYDGTQIGEKIYVQENLYAEYKGETPTRQETDSEAYQFAGWLSSLTNTSISNTPITQNTTFVAQYVVTKLFVVKWYNWNGELLVTTKVKDGDRAYYPSYEPSRPGDEQYSFYTFVGWDKDTALVKSDMEFVAVYTPGDLAKHIIEWYSEGKLIEQDQEVEYGTVLSYDGQMPTKEGSSFYGWSTDPNSVVGKKENEFKAEGPFEDGKMKLYAVFGDQDRIEITFNFGDKVPSGNIGVKFSINNKIEEEDEYVTMEWGDGNTESTKEIYDTSYPTNTSYSEPRTYVKTMYHPTTKYQSNTDYTIKIVRYGLNFKFAYFGSYSKMIENSLAPYVKKINISSDLDSTYAPIGITYGCYNLEELIIGPRVINLNNTGNNSTSNPFTTSDLKLISVSEENPIYDSRNDCNAIIETETNTLIVGTSSTTIPQNVVKIGKNAFYNRSSLTTITIPTSVLEIEEYAFYNCNSLTNINIHSGIDTIPSYCFYNCSKLSNFNFSNLKLIKQSAFYNNGFTNLILSNSKSLKTIESSAFAGCVKLTSVTIPDNVTSLGSAAFSGCSTLSTINTGDGIILLSNSMFNKCLKLSNVTLSSNLVSIGSSAFYECSSLTSITLPSKVNTIESNAFYKCSKLSTVNFSESLVSINSSAFYECSSLSTLNLSNKVKTIGYSAFYGCYNLTSANFGTTFLETIGEKAFYECYRITSVNLPNTLQNIGPNAFYGCSKITSITIPESVSFIGSSPFSMCRTLEKIIVNEGNQYFTSDINGVLYNKNQTSLIQFPPGKQVENNMYTIADTVTEIGDYAFASCVYLEIIVSPDTITSIGNYAFSGSNLARFEVSSSTETIGSYAFYGCSRLNSLIINNGVKTIGERAFENCIALSELTLPDSVTSIGQAAFMNCSYLEKLVLSNGLKTIPNNFCNECDLLNNVVIPDSVTSIGSWAFSKCNSLKNIIIGSGVTSIDSYAFYTESSVTDRKIRMKPSVAPTIASNTFTKEYFTKANNCSIIVDYSSSNAILTGYLEATNWVSYKDIITSILAYTVNEFDFGGIQKSINESNEMVLNALPNSGYKFANWYNYTPGELIIPESSLINATFDKDLLVTYPFKLNENGYYESGNKNAGATFSKARFKFNVTKENQGILIKYISNGESSWDFGIIGKIDTILPNNNSTNSSTDYVNFKGQASTEEKKVVIAGLTTGEHFIEVKYIKDSSGNSGDDSLQVKVYLGDLKTEIIYGDLYSQEPEINVGVIDITNITKEPLSLIAKFEKEV